LEARIIPERIEHGIEPEQRNSILPISIQSVYASPIIVPVVQRTEQGFPKVKTVFLLESSDVLTSVQNVVFKRLESLLQSSHVISNVPIFTPTGDTTGDTNSPPFSLAPAYIRARV